MAQRETSGAFKSHESRRAVWWLVLLTGAWLCLGCTPESTPASDANAMAGTPAAPHIQSLQQLSLKALRARDYGSTLRIEQEVPASGFKSYLASYDSDGLRLYTRIDVPDQEPPEDGFGVVVFIHGWRGIEAAPSLDFYYAPDSYYHDMVAAYRKAGFVVLTPGLRGHGTVNGVAADGIEYMAAWDNGSYLSPVFYAIDVLNLLDGLPSLAVAKINHKRINLSSHSQGGDVTLIALAVAGEGSRVATTIHAASIWSGTFARRFTQLKTYAPMQKSAQAFLAGDGSWNGTATGKNGAVNPHFVFGYPPDWIATVNPDEWTWQRDTWSTPTVADAVRVKLEQMYSTINQYVGNIHDAAYQLDASPQRRLKVHHDPRIVAAMAAIDPFDNPQWLREPLALHYSDRDFYSLPVWNEELCADITQVDGRCDNFEYLQNSHSLRVSEHRWFSSEQAVAGFATALCRDIRLFGGADPDSGCPTPD